ncbi:MAG TPA: hypothetical protein PKX38_09220 [Alphaproteobacteria bacterium]|nr:hypothetical protein [Micavibrio sp.]MBK9563558.1 hypothetical protein [Micavibrio sp.]HQX28099.1 hypothetical protein [Alphaproteobacteria bacterium]
MQADSTGAGKSLRTIIAMRHGSYYESGLTKAGQDDVRSTALKLRDKFNVTKILTTPVPRGVQTAQIVSDVFEGVNVEDVLKLGQHADFSDIMHLIRDLPDDVREVLFVTHEAQIIEMTIRLTGEEFEVPTAGGVKFSTDKNWSEIKPGTIKDVTTFDHTGVHDVPLSPDSAFL